MRKLNYDDVKKYVESYGFELISTEYHGVHDKIKIKCSKGHESEMIFSNFKRRHGCPKCSNRAKLKYEDVKKFIENEGYKLLSDTYENNRAKLKIECPKHGVVEISFTHFKQTKKCPKCGKESVLGRTNNTYNEVKECIENEGYTLISLEYKSSKKQKLKIECPQHGIFEMTFNSFKQGHRCPQCGIENNANKRRLNYEDIKEYIESNGYKLISKEYKTNRDKLKMICDKGHMCEISYSNFKRGKRCVKCSSSKGEERIDKILNENRIEFKRQYKFKDCKVHKELPFDFYLSRYNCCIEFDGRQHYEIVSAFGGVNAFIDTKIRDTIKTEYCKKNNIKLIRIPYWEIDNIDKILKNELKIS